MEPGKKEIFKLAIDKRYDELIRIASSPDVEVRRTALGLLSDASPEEAVAIFAHTANHDHDLGCRLTAVGGLKKIGGEQAERGLLDALRTEREPGATFQILAGIEKIGTPLSIPGLEVIAKSDDKYLRSKAAIVLLEIGISPESEKVLLGLLDDQRWGTRFLIVSAGRKVHHFRRLKSTPLIPYL